MGASWRIVTRTSDWKLMRCGELAVGVALPAPDSGADGVDVKLSCWLLLAVAVAVSEPGRGA